MVGIGSLGMLMTNQHHVVHKYYTKQAQTLQGCDKYSLSKERRNNMMNESSMSPADFAAMTGGMNNGWGNDGGWWLILLFLFCPYSLL